MFPETVNCANATSTPNVRPPMGFQFLSRRSKPFGSIPVLLHRTSSKFGASNHFLAEFASRTNPDAAGILFQVAMYRRCAVTLRRAAPRADAPARRRRGGDSARG